MGLTKFMAGLADKWRRRNAFSNLIQVLALLERSRPRKDQKIWKYMARMPVAIIGEFPDLLFAAPQAPESGLEYHNATYGVITEPADSDFPQEICFVGRIKENGMGKYTVRAGRCADDERPQPLHLYYLEINSEKSRVLKLAGLMQGTSGLREEQGYRHTRESDIHCSEDMTKKLAGIFFELAHFEPSIDDGKF